MSAERKTTSEMAAEAMREVGILVLVFGGLLEHSPGRAGWLTLAAVVVYVAGSVLERRRTR